MQNLFLTCIFFVTILATTSAQVDSLYKNKLQLFYSPNVSKTNFNSSIENAHFGFGKEFYQTARPSQPIMGYSFGLAYSRTLSNSDKIIFTLRRNVYGQSSPLAYNYRGVIPSDTLPGYGGLQYKVSVWSYSFSIGYQKEVLRKRLLHFFVMGGIGIDVYDKAILQNYILNRETGVLSYGCCTGYYIKFSTFQKLNGFLYPFQKGFYRIELSVAANAQFDFSKRLFLFIQPEFRYLTNLVGASTEFVSLVPHGDIISINLNLGIGAYF